MDKAGATFSGINGVIVNNPPSYHPLSDAPNVRYGATAYNRRSGRRRPPRPVVAPTKFVPHGRSPSVLAFVASISRTHD